MYVMEKEAEKEKEKLVQMSAISLQMDSYDGIFSDFDPRSYSQRSISDDFLLEAKKASKDKPSGQIELHLLIPKQHRNSAHEITIRKRLKDHFKRHLDIVKKEVKGVLKMGVGFVLFGILVMFLATYVLFKFPEENFFTHFMVIMLEPAGWFLFWEGLNLVVFKTKEKRPELTFQEKMSKVDVVFSGY